MFFDSQNYFFGTGKLNGAVVAKSDGMRTWPLALQSLPKWAQWYDSPQHALDTLAGAHRGVIWGIQKITHGGVMAPAIYVWLRSNDGGAIGGQET
jgi:hypothetical protein